MSNFQKDVQLLADLQGLIEKREKQVNPPEGSTAIMGAISPVLRAAMPGCQAHAGPLCQPHRKRPSVSLTSWSG